MPRRGDRGTVALETALALPVMVLTVMGLYDTSRVLTSWSRMALAADAVTQIATNFLVDPTNDSPSVLLQPSARQATDSVFAYLPDWAGLQPNRFSITLTSVRSNGGTASTVWSYSSARGQRTRRPCGALGVGGGAAQIPPTMLKIPAFLVADVSLMYQPMFLKFFRTGFRFSTTSYMAARSLDVSSIGYAVPADPNVTYCGGS